MLDGTYFEQKDPTKTEVLDNMVSANYVDFGYNIAYRMARFFVSAMSGNYIFTVSCDDMCTVYTVSWDGICTVYFNHGIDNIRRTKYKIIELKNAT